MTTNELTSLKQELPRGSRQILAERTGYCKRTIDHVLAGRRSNDSIVFEAIMLRDEIRDSKEKLRIKLKAIKAIN